MAVFHPQTVRCSCGHTVAVQLAEAVNAGRSPAIRQQILDGTFHRAQCLSCSAVFTVETSFTYTDLSRNCLFLVSPKGQRHNWKDASQVVEHLAGLVTDELQHQDSLTLRVVFGLDELREKLVAQDSSFDDRLVELMKVLLIYEHPVLVTQPRLRLKLEEADVERVTFSAAYEHHPRRFRASLPRWLAESLEGQKDELRDWTATSHKDNIFELKEDHWVNLWRWSPQPSSLDKLKKYAADLRAGKPIQTNTQDFKQMLKTLPRGKHLPPWAKQDLRTLFEFAKKQGDQMLQDALFELRFGFELEDDWARNSDTEDIDTLWKLLKDLPDTNVEGNTFIHELQLDQGQRGGTYDPSSYDISIGELELSNLQGFTSVVRHEVGHAVHEQRTKLVDSWLQQRFGWQTFVPDGAGIDAWVRLMGGYGSSTPAQIAQIRTYIKTALGPGSRWNPGPSPKAPAGHPWRAANFGPRLALEKTGSNWFQNFATWHRSGKRAFYFNFWYQTLIAVDDETLKLVAKMPSSYASMSHYEFFAELYALYFDLNDPLRKNIPQDVQDWLGTNIGAPEPGAPRPSRPRDAKEYETVVRPAAGR